MSIDYNHSQNRHTLAGPQAALRIIFGDYKLSSLLDVGCGTGTWLKAAIELGVTDVFGVDGVALNQDALLIPKGLFRQQDLTGKWDLGRRFDAILCLEVAEHLEQSSGRTLVETLTKHSDRVFFSAACPGQIGQHHINCRWPAYWQGLFNEHGFACSEEIRWKIWENEEIEAWYRQNLLVASRAPDLAGKEPRLRAVVHPEIAELMVWAAGPSNFPIHLKQIEEGRLPVGWYCSIPFSGLANKLRRHNR